MRKPNRTSLCWHLFPFLHTCWVAPSPSGPLNSSKQYRLPLPSNPSILRPHPSKQLRRQILMGCMSPSIPSKNTIIWGPPLAPKSPRRGPRCRLYNSSCYPPQTWGLRNDTSPHSPRATHGATKLPIYYPRPVRGDYNWLHLLATNRLKIAHCLLLRQPHRPGSRRHPNPNPLRILRRPHSHNRTRPHLISPFLPG